ncbi:hypothetical protein FNYG_12440 [Fusarium nygamai]|uniref:Sulfatase N-terminal domain-containing protein n=1 Tax=Gibberella nygamai TaxID=42673 RepID=A0A2K0VWI8_GIBNY|nr:hypothetical protein FNYG_12440 [Fusarium nygamai]
MAKPNKPNIVVIMSDDQDARLGSLQAQPFVREVLSAEGLTLENHFATVAQCCPSRTSFLRGQASHNTNLTHVGPPGQVSTTRSKGCANDRLVERMRSLYILSKIAIICRIGSRRRGIRRNVYIGKFMNGVNMATYSPGPKGWDHTDILVHPYQYSYNNVVMSQNGKRPLFYNGYHQTDVIKAKALARLESLASSEDPFYIQIAPTAPHTSGDGPSVPCARHMWAFNNATAPRTPNFNPEDKWQSLKPGWLKERKYLTQDQIAFVDWQYRSRLQSLLGIDEMVQDIYDLLQKKGALENTYLIYTTDNGFHMGQHRQIGGKGLPYLEDTNIPMIIRGPGISHGSTSKIPSSHVDMAPTFLELAGMQKDSEYYPPFFDGRSLIGEWKNPEASHSSEKEILNVEFWGTISNGGSPDYELRSGVYAYKTLRIVSDTSSWLFSRWCTNNDTELYDTTADPYELNNLAINPTPESQRIIHRLNGLLLVTKSCNQESCRDPWKVLQRDSGGSFTTLAEAMDAKYDAFFAALPSVGYQKCMNYQATENERPYYPPESISLASEYRKSTDNFPFTNVVNFTRVPGSTGRMGSSAHRHVNLTAIMENAREVTDKELGHAKICRPEDCKAGGAITTDGIFNSCCPGGD